MTKKRYNRNKSLQSISRRNYARRYTLSKGFGLTEPMFAKLVTRQNGVCAICGEAETAKSTGGGIKRLAIDHCHATHKIRGLLCQRCNHLLGMAKDSVVVLKKAIVYLETADTGLIIHGSDMAAEDLLKELMNSSS